MTRKVSAEVLPLRLWAGVAFLCLVLIVALYIIAEWLKAREPKHYNLQRLEQFSGKTSIIALGNSLTFRAMFYDSIMQTKIRPVSEDLSFVRITEPGAFLKEFEPILSHIASSKPDYVIVQLEMLIHQFNTNNGSGILQIRQNLRNVKHWILSNFLTEVHSRFQANFGTEPVCRYIPDNNRHQMLKSHSERYNRLTVRGPELTPEWKRFIETVHANGGKIIFLEIGRSETASHQLSETFKLEYESVLKQLEESYPVQLWRYPGPFPSENYCDLAHLNNKGRDAFMEWFLPELRGLIND